MVSNTGHNGHDGVSNHHPHDCLLNCVFTCRSKKTSKVSVTSLCAGNSLVTGEFPAQMTSNAENVSIWRRHHETFYGEISWMLMPRHPASLSDQQWWCWLVEVCLTYCLSLQYIDGFVQERRNSSALALELRLSCTNPSIWGYNWSAGPVQFRWLKGYIYSSCYYRHQIGSINLTHCYPIFPWLCAWDVCYIIFCHLLHIHSG